ncbi:hypothetical protein Dimus_031664 [Dionaea muscipula]
MNGMKLVKCQLRTLEAYNSLREYTSYMKDEGINTPLIKPDVVFKVLNGLTQNISSTKYHLGRSPGESYLDMLPTTAKELLNTHSNLTLPFHECPCSVDYYNLACIVILPCLLIEGLKGTPEGHSGCVRPLPDKKGLELILDKLQNFRITTMLLSIQWTLLPSERTLPMGLTLLWNNSRAMFS